MPKIARYNSPAEIGQRLRMIRHAREASLSQIADEAGLSAATMSRIETGKQDLSVATLLVICDTLGCSPDDVLLNESRDPASLLAALGDVQRAKEAFAAAAAHVENMERRLRAFGIRDGKQRSSK